jgi:hypothetical protein
MADDDTKSLDAYVLVKRPVATQRPIPGVTWGLAAGEAPAVTGVDEKSKNQIPAVMPAPNQVRLGAKRSLSRALTTKGGKNREINTDLFYRANTVGSASVALAVTYLLTPSQSAEFAGFAGLFDEIKVNTAQIRFITNTAFAGTLASPPGAFGAIAYDSTYATTPTSVAEVLESSQAMLFHATPTIANNTHAPEPTTKNGLYTFDIKIPKGPVANATAVTGGTGINANFPGQWMAIGDTADSVGYVRLYIEPMGTGSINSASLIVKLNCSMRERT